jgi:hypothetical protein
MLNEVPLDIRENMAYPKKWQAKANPAVPYREYPKMPLVAHRYAKDLVIDGKVIGKRGELSGKAPVPILDTFKQPIVFASARDEAEWLADHPEEAAEIAEAEETRAAPLDKLKASNEALQAVTDRLQSAKAELEQKDTALADAFAQLESAKLELTAARAKRAAETAGAKLDMRTKEGREAAAAAKAAEG